MVILIWALRLLLAGVFFIAGIGKLVDRKGARASIVAFGVSPALADIIGLLLPIAELGLALALFPAWTVQWGAAGLIGLLLVFIAAISVNLIRGNHPDCRCFGQIHSTPVGAATLWRNGVLTTMAAAVWWQAPVSDWDALLAGLRPLETGLPAALTVFVSLLLLQGWAVFILLRQNGRLLLRVKALEAKQPMAEEKKPGLPIGATAPGFALKDLDGETVTLESLTAIGKLVVLVFTEPGCGVCETQFPELAKWQTEHADRLTIALISSGKIEANRNRRDTHGLQRVLLQEKHEVADAYQSHGTPAAVVIENGKIASQLAEGIPVIRTLIVRSTLPPTPELGERVPSMELQDLDGNSLDLGSLRGRRRLLLFWNPDCMYCEGMLADLQTHERVRVSNAPELLVLSTGSVELNRGQGIKARILLDPHFAAGAMLGASGTPASVLIDEEGQVASTVEAGPRAVFERLGFLPYVPTPHEVVEAMLKMAGVSKKDTVYDLGCGDGRILVTAAKKYGARGVGVDINPERLAEARAGAKKASVESLVRFEEGQLLEMDFRNATVVAFYLLPKIISKLRPKFLADLQPGTRLISHDFDMGDDWLPDRQEVIGGSKIFMWVVPGPK